MWFKEFWGGRLCQQDLSVAGGGGAGHYEGGFLFASAF